MDLSDIIILLIIIFGSALLIVLAYLGITIFLQKRNSEKLGNKILKESSLLKGLDKKDNKAVADKNKKNEANSKEEPVIMQNDQPKRALTKEEIEKQKNPFGVDMTRRLNKTDKTNPNNKFIK